MLLPATTPAHITQARELFQEYASSLGFDLCFQSFQQELDSLPGDYSPPSGRLLLAFHDDALAGCVALHAHESSKTICEMKRLYVRPQFRGHHIGQRLISAIIAAAREIGYTHMRLDTVSGTMDKAIALYRSYGFKEIPSYRLNPIEGVLYMELTL
ncbi:MAG: GCN5-related N-acetyltransferase [Acidobacteriales bacterium]|nr:GCN5-related N-acetyltransferase [Terriglobales bacterium]